MVSMTYASLITQIEDYLDRTDTQLVSNIPIFINMAEIRCAREVKNLGSKTAVVSSFTAASATYQKPARLLEVISINYGSAESFTTTQRQNASGTRTLTLSAAHNFVVGQNISVFNVGGTSYNGDFAVSAITQFTVSYVSGSGTEAATADTSGIVTAALNERTTLYPRSYEFCNDYWPDRTQTGDPKFYADYDYGHWFIVPTPTITNPFEVVYYQRPEPLSDTNQTNWFTEYAPDLLFYACLLESMVYLKNDQRVSVWKDYYTQAASAIKMEDSKRKFDATIERKE